MNSIVLPYSFTPNTTIASAQVNADFSALLNAINNNTRSTLAVVATYNVSPTQSAFGPSSTPITDTLTGIQSRIDLNGQNILIQLANGNYAESVTFLGPLTGQRVPSSVTIQGNISSPTSVVISGNPPLMLNDGAGLVIQGVQLVSPSSHGLVSGDGCTIGFQQVDFGAMPSGSHIVASRQGFVFGFGNYSISAGAQSHINADAANVFIQGAAPPGVAPPVGVPVVNVNGTPSFSVAFAVASNSGATIKCHATFVGAATGFRFSVSTNAVIATGGAGPNYFPGNAAGITATGGQYV